MEGIFFHIRVQIYIPLQFQRVRTDLLESNFSLTEFFFKALPNAFAFVMPQG